jgi:2-methylaconitate cis-trans-isomerase PrpF
VPDGDQIRLHTVIIRSGTSKGIFLRPEELPEPGPERDAVILALFGSPDPRQIDGLGGGDLLTSKVAIVGPPTHPDADVDYLFGQVDVKTAVVDWSGNCGNVSSGVGPYAIDAGLVEAVEPQTTVRIHNVNTERILLGKVPVAGGKAVTVGETHIDGVPGSGALIEMDFAGSVGGRTGKLLPLGAPSVPVAVGGEEIAVTLVDAGNLTAFVRARDIGFEPAMTWEEMASAPVLARVEEIRGAIAVAAGVAPSLEWWGEAPRLLPQLSFVAEPAAYTSQSDGRPVAAEEIDFLARLFVIATFHRAYPLTGLTAAAVASRLRGSVVNDCIDPDRRAEPRVRLGHPCGAISARVEVDDTVAPPEVKEIIIERTARRLMEGDAFLPASLDWRRG